MHVVQKGFSLIEVVVTVAIIGILTSIALPQYRAYVTTARLTDAFSALSSVLPAAEQYWSNQRTFAQFDGLPPDTANFTFALSDDSVSTYTVTATGAGQVSGFTYTINQSGTRATTAAPDNYGTSSSCWVDREGGGCTE
jgi:type IV pilus assembly protein PilE